MAVNETLPTVEKTIVGGFAIYICSVLESAAFVTFCHSNLHCCKKYVGPFYLF